MEFHELLMNLPGIDRFLIIMTFLLVILLLTYHNMHTRAQAEEELKDRLDTLRDSIDRKDNRIREIHHRVKNNLQMISSMIGLQAKECEDRKLKERMQKCQSRVHMIAVIHELLNDQSEQNAVRIRPYLQRLIQSSLQFLNGTLSGVEVNTEIDRIVTHPQTATSCGLIVNELLTNCFKHAFDGSEEGEICIRFERSNEHMDLSVEDNGSGFDAEDFRSSSRPGGQDIMQSLVDVDLNGEMDVQNTTDGTRVRITFPATDPAIRHN